MYTSRKRPWRLCITRLHVNIDNRWISRTLYLSLVICLYTPSPCQVLIQEANTKMRRLRLPEVLSKHTHSCFGVKLEHCTQTSCKQFDSMSNVADIKHHVALSFIVGIWIVAYMYMCCYNKQIIFYFIFHKGTDFINLTKCKK